jgi:molecular chaperone DnaJ
MAKSKDLYAILGVSKSASADDIRKAYRGLARKHHPDLNPDDARAEEQFKRVSFAYDVLSDPEKRRRYDEFGDDGLKAGFDAERARAYRRWADSGHGFSFGSGDFGFEQGGGGRGRRAGGFADILSEMFGAAAGREEPPREVEPRDLEHGLEIDLLDALRGTQTTVSVRRPVPCARCKGSGRAGRRACTECTGTGSVEKRERLSARIPAGVDDGFRVRVAGKGGIGARNGTAGNLYFRIRVRPHPLVRRDGKDLTVEVPVTVTEAVRGATITVPTLNGPRALTVPPGSQSGTRLRLRGHGAPDPKGGAPGDFYVRLMVQVPVGEGAAGLHDALDAIAAAYPVDPRANLSF